MAVTPIDLYRAGDIVMGPDLGYVNVPRDADVFQNGGVDWVRAQSPATPGGAKGVSTSSVTRPLRRPNSRWWRLPANTPIPVSLGVFNDHGNHWLWVPLNDMEKIAFERDLASLNASFVFP
jgi:hypothetical protein